MSTHERLKALEEELEAKGADGARLEIVRRARVFKRSWVDMASGLTQIRRKRLWSKWGYEDFISYCSLDLLLTEATVEKLTGSYAVVREHAPKVLERDGIQEPLPAMDAIEYFAKVVRDDSENEPEEEALDELKQAVFDDNKSVAVLRRTFNPVFFPKAEGVEQVETLEKIRTTARRLEGLIQRAEGLSEEPTRRLTKSLVKLRDELAELIPKAKAELEQREAS